MSYGNQEYGGGASNNYYDQNQNFSGRNENSYEGRSEGRDNYGSHNQGGNGGYGQEQSYGNQGGNNYGRQEESYGRQEQSYGRQEESHGRRNSNYDDDLSSAASHAQEHHGSEDKSLFNSALSFIQERKGQYSGDVDEQQAVNAHQAMYGSGSSQGQTHDSGTVGAGAAMQALKMFTGGSEGSGSSSGGMDKNKLIGLAMAQAGKLWDEKQGSGNVVCFFLLDLVEGLC
jgi:hypothetical protein